jgi:hypothetical protein
MHMALDPATIAKVVEIGVKLYQFIDKVANKGEKGDQLQPIVDQLNAIRSDISSMGEKLRLALDGVKDEIIGDIRLTQQARLPGAHAAIRDYQRTHTDLTQRPDVNNANYVTARTVTLDVKTYFLGHTQLAFMGGFIQAMNARIAFIVGLDICWLQHNPEYVSEIREGVTHLQNYIAYIRSQVNQEYRLVEKENFIFVQPEEPPFDKPHKELVSVTFFVTGPGGQTFFNQTVPPEQRGATRSKAQAVRNQASTTGQNQVMGPYNQILAVWNGLVANAAAASVQRALLPDSESAPVQIESAALAVTALREVAPAQLLRAANGDQPTEAVPARYELPMRDVVLAVLGSQEFQQRQERSLRGSDKRTVSFWYEKALQRKPSAEEAETLGKVLQLFGHRSFFHCLGYSREYEERWGAGLPVQDTAEPVATA